MLRIPLQHQFLSSFNSLSPMHGALVFHRPTCNVVLANDTAVIGTTQEGFGRRRVQMTLVWNAVLLVQEILRRLINGLRQNRSGLHRMKQGQLDATDVSQVGQETSILRNVRWTIKRVRKSSKMPNKLRHRVERFQLSFNTLAVSRLVGLRQVFGSVLKLDNDISFTSTISFPARV